MSAYSLSYPSDTDNDYSQTSLDNDYDPDATTDDECLNTPAPKVTAKRISKHPSSLGAS